jgi:enterochelin esterase-like enzyme
LSEMGISSLLVSIEDIDYAVINDETGKNEQALEFLLNDFLPVCSKEIYQDEWTRLYEVTCK